MFYDILLLSILLLLLVSLNYVSYSLGFYRGAQNRDVFIDSDVREDNIARYLVKTVERVNEHRRGIGIENLSIDPYLTKIAQNKAKDMYRNNYFDHEDKDGAYTWEKINNHRYLSSEYGENLGRGYYYGIGDYNKGSDYIISAWIASDGHRKNIENPMYSKIGVGYFGGYTVHLFAGENYLDLIK